VSGFQPKAEQVLAKREPQNTESAAGGNIEGKENFVIRHSMFDFYNIFAGHNARTHLKNRKPL